MEDIARIYDSVNARPGWPTTASEAEVDAELTRQGLRPEQRRSLIGMMRQDVCRLPEMVPVCRYYGAETIYKVQRLGWGPSGRRADERRGSTLMLQMRLLEHGANRTLARAYGERGLSDAAEVELNNAGRAAAPPIQLITQNSTWFGCATHERNLAPGTPIWPQYRLTTCGAGFGFITRLLIFGKEFWAYELDTLLTHSRFARKFLGVWWLTGAEPVICANSIIGGNGNNVCNTYSWSSPVSFNIGSTTNPTLTVVSSGHAMRLNQPFWASIGFQ